MCVTDPLFQFKHLFQDILHLSNQANIVFFCCQHQFVCHAHYFILQEMNVCHGRAAS